ncbi:MAG: DNA repair protein RecN [Proteobacteria bacterium]|nr:DNA repair protein RecN [Pseudomonadota bacterium]
MLTRLSISGIVLIDRLDLEFGRGLNVLTGETGAGKSILLDALALALGARSDVGLIRHGCESASVIAEFFIPALAAGVGSRGCGAECGLNNQIDSGDSLMNPSPVRYAADPCRKGKGERSALYDILSELDIDAPDGMLILRRTLSADGKSRAWINDVPVGIKTLKQVGDECVEIHGQFESHSLLDPATHVAALDEFASSCPPTGPQNRAPTPPKGGVVEHVFTSQPVSDKLLPPWGESAALSRATVGGQKYIELLSAVRNTYHEWRAADKKLHDLQDLLARSAAEREFLEHNVKELESLRPVVGEEAMLAAQRAMLMDMEKNGAILKEAHAAMMGGVPPVAGRCGGRDIGESLFNAAHILGRIKTDPNPYAAQIDKLYELGAAVAEVAEQIAPRDAVDMAALESSEERLFALRAAARKHRVAPDELPNKLAEMAEQLAALDNSDAELKRATAAAVTARAAYDAAAGCLHAARVDAAKNLRAEILAELPDLKLKSADFDVAIETGAPTAAGADAITFMIKTNPGTPFAPLNKIASGGELARLMLALRVVLSHGNAAKTFVFDEVDTGISGATASAVGQRLARLAGSVASDAPARATPLGGSSAAGIAAVWGASSNKINTSSNNLIGSSPPSAVATSGAEPLPPTGAPARLVVSRGVGMRGETRRSQTAPLQQVIVVTHSAQVAGFGDTHYLIKKSSDGKTTTTDVCKLAGDARLSEIARIISGEKITPEAVATAKTLLKNT